MTILAMQKRPHLAVRAFSFGQLVTIFDLWVHYSIFISTFQHKIIEFMAGLWLYSIPFAVPQSGRLIWWRIALGWSGALPADNRTRQWGSLWLR